MTTPGTAAEPAEGTFAVGVAVRAVEVPDGTPMAGYAGRLGGTTGVHDPTTVRALVIDGVGIVAVDVCALHEDTCTALAIASGLDAVVVAATHTHSGPSVGLGRVGPHAEGVHTAVVAAALAALSDAAASATPCRAAWTTARGSGVAKDRRHLERTIDPPATALTFTEASGRAVAVLASYPCHPVVLDATNTLVTADWVHPFRERLEQALDAPVVFLTGTAGDVNDGHSPDASFDAATDDLRTFERAAELGRRVADSLLAATPAPVDAAGPARFTSAGVTLHHEPGDAEAIRARADAWRAQLPRADAGLQAVLRIWIEWAEAWRPGDGAEPWQGRVGRLALGDVSVVTLPGEPFLAVSEAIAARVDAPVLVAGYCDGVPGYLPTADAYPEGGYEVDDAHMYYAMPGPFRRGSAEEVIDAAVSLFG